MTEVPTQPPETTRSSTSGAARRSTASSAGRRPPATTHVPGRAAAQHVQRAEHIAVTLPVVGQVQLPPPDHLAFYGGLLTLAALELVEWPITLALAVGHVLASNHHNRTISELGKALEEA